MIFGDHLTTITNIQKELPAICSFFASQRSYGYALSQENEHITQQLLFSNLSEVIK